MLPQLLRRDCAPSVLDAPRPGQSFDFSYEADPCRLCPAGSCDRHLQHAHSCPTSKSKTGVRHDLVKYVRRAAVEEAGFHQVENEPRTNAAGDQKRADISFVNRFSKPETHYITDDTIAHPLCNAHINSDVLAKKEKLKNDEYAVKLAQMRNSLAVVHGAKKIVFLACVMTSLGEYGKQMREFILTAAEHFKLHNEYDLRDDGLSVETRAARFRFALRANIQAAILKGNGMLANFVGL